MLIYDLNSWTKLLKTMDMNLAIGQRKDLQPTWSKRQELDEAAVKLQEY
jgi:hypothetical protein